MYTRTKGLEYRYIYDIPVAYRDKLCTCEHIKYDTKSDRPWNCVCGKVAIHHLHRCVKCDVIFIKDFDWPWWCIVDSQCWDCIQTMDKACERHGVIPLYRETGGPYRKPLGLNPKRYTEEEMSGFSFDFE